MLDIIKLAESKKDESNLMDIKAKVKSFAINYIFAIRKISPMLKWSRENLSKSECMLMAGYINDVNKQAMEVLFNLISLVEPVSGELVRDEISYAESVDRAIRDGDFGGMLEKNEKKSEKTKKDSPTFTVPVDKDYEREPDSSGKSRNIIKKMFNEFMEGLKSGMDEGAENAGDKPPEKKPRKPRRKKGDDGKSPNS